MATVSGDDLLARAAGGSTAGRPGNAMVVVEGPPTGPAEVLEAAAARLATDPCVRVGGAGWDGADPVALALVDVVAAGDDLDAVAATVEQAPHAAVTLALHLRAAPWADVPAGLVAESAAYSLLQAGDEFARWRAATPRQQRPPVAGPAVVATREGDVLVVELARPEVRNALGVELRDGLLEALAVAEGDPALRVVLRGRGPAFCAGGHLDEFGTFPDPQTAHEIRLATSIGAVLHRLSERTTVQLHGPCYGSGIELAAFASRVVAAPDTTAALPELRLGLIPGAGGTVSLPRRIGRHRTAWLALTGLPVDAATALAWGLVDEVIDAATSV